MTFVPPTRKPSTAPVKRCQVCKGPILPAYRMGDTHCSKECRAKAFEATHYRFGDLARWKWPEEV